MEPPIWRTKYSRKTVTFTISMPIDMLDIVETIGEKEGYKRSTAIQYLVHLGITYYKVMELREKEKATIKRGLERVLETIED